MAPLFWADTGPATPKVDVRGAVFREDGRLLLVRERSDGLWTLPGGWADVGESPSEAVAREIQEEAGYRVRVRQLAAVLDRSRQGHPPHPNYVYKLMFCCDLLDGAPAGNHEITEVDFFDPQQLPPLSLTRITPAEIARLAAHWHRPGLPADFD